MTMSRSCSQKKKKKMMIARTVALDAAAAAAISSQLVYVEIQYDFALHVIYTWHNERLSFECRPMPSLSSVVLLLLFLRCCRCFCLYRYYSCRRHEKQILHPPSARYCTWPIVECVGETNIAVQNIQDCWGHNYWMMPRLGKFSSFSLHRRATAQ